MLYKVTYNDLYVGLDNLPIFGTSAILVEAPNIKMAISVFELIYKKHLTRSRNRDRHIWRIEDVELA